MPPRIASLLALVALFPACSGSASVSVQTSGASVAGSWTGTIAETSVLSWQLAEVPGGHTLLVSGDGEIRSTTCLTTIHVEGTRSGPDSVLTLTIPDAPGFSMSIIGAFVGDKFEGIYATESGAPPAGCLPVEFGLLRVGPRTEGGLNGSFEGTWIPDAPLPGPDPVATLHLTQAGGEVFGTVTWEDYPCSSGGFFFGELNGTELLANVRSLQLEEAFHFLDATWNAEERTITGITRLLGPGPGPECSLLAEETVQLSELRPLETTETTTVETLGVLIEREPDGSARVVGRLLRKTDRPRKPR